jgi:hypothetical protein
MSLAKTLKDPAFFLLNNKKLKIARGAINSSRLKKLKKEFKAFLPLTGFEPQTHVSQRCSTGTMVVRP